jgi:ankyrin repeat protein
LTTELLKSATFFSLPLRTSETFSHNLTRADIRALIRPRTSSLVMAAEDHFTQLLVTATQNGDLPLIKSHFPTLPPSSPILKAIALASLSSHQPEILRWCFTQGFCLPPSSLNSDFYHSACASQSPTIFQVLVENGFDLNSHNSEFFGCGTALVVSAVHGNISFARWLLENGQDVNASFSCEAIVYAVGGENRSLEMVDLLIKHGLKLQGTGAAIGAAEKDDVAMLRLCLENGAGLEEREIWWLVPMDEGDVEGTALYRACRAGALGAVQELVNRGADLQWRDERGRDCVGVAREMGRLEVIRWLTERGLVKEAVRVRELRMVDERNWAWKGELPDVFCVD